MYFIFRFFKFFGESSNGERKGIERCLVERQTRGESHAESHSHFKSLLKNFIPT